VIAYNFQFHPPFWAVLRKRHPKQQSFIFDLSTICCLLNIHTK